MREDERYREQYEKALYDASNDKIESLKQAVEEFEKLGNYSDSVQQAEKAKRRLRKLLKEEEAEKEQLYNEAVDLINNQDDSIETLQSAVEILQSIKEYKDSLSLLSQTNYRIYEIKTYNEAMTLAGKDTVKDIDEAVFMLERIRSYKDVNHQIDLLNQRVNYLKEKEKKEELERQLSVTKTVEEEKVQKIEKKQKKNSKTTRILLIFLLIVVAGGGGAFYYFYHYNAYCRAVEHFNNGEYELAVGEFEKAGSYADSEDLINLSKERYIKEHYDTVKTPIMYDYFEELQAAGYPIDEKIVDSLTSFKVRLFFNNHSDISSNATKVNINQKIYIHYTCSTGYKEQELPVRLVLSVGEKQIVTYEGLVIKAGSHDYIELDQETKDKIGTGIVKAILYDENGKQLFIETTLFSSK